jgi:hypothetical protein
LEAGTFTQTMKKGTRGLAEGRGRIGKLSIERINSNEEQVYRCDSEVCILRLFFWDVNNHPSSAGIHAFRFA